MRVNAITIVFLVLFAAIVVGTILLQIFLSKRESRWPGLTMPIISFLFSLIYPLNMAVPSAGAATGFAFQMILVWLLANIPTFILLAIYFACREKKRKSSQLNKMNIQDLD